MEQNNNNFRNLIFVIAAIAGAGLIIYGAFFYSNPKAAEQPAAISQATEKNTQEVSFTEPFLGDLNAKVTVTEYASHLCGHCIAFAKETFPKLEEEYIKTNKIKFVYRSFPPLEVGMSLACANDQEKFWEYSHEAYAKGITKEEDLKTFAGNIGLNQDQFNQCLDTAKYQSVAENWFKQGQDAGVEGTPTFFINDKQIVGNQPYEEFRKVIEEELAK